jgi:hypothetical protein
MRLAVVRKMVTPHPNVGLMLCEIAIERPVTSVKLNLL